MKTEIKLWKEYLKHIEKLNKPIVEYNRKQVEEYIKRNKEAMQKYFRDEKRIDEAERINNKEHDDWLKLPWYKQFFTPEPMVFYYHRPVIWSTYPPFTKSTTKPTYEDFLTWLVVR